MLISLDDCYAIKIEHNQKMGRGKGQVFTIDDLRQSISNSSPFNYIKRGLTFRFSFNRDDLWYASDTSLT